MNEIKVLDLFSGIGGFSLGLERAGPFRTVAFCEQDAFCQAVLRKHWPDVPIYDDVRTIDADGLGRIDLVLGGFPCQPWSAAGQQRGAEDDRDLWPEMLRIIETVQSRWIIGENVRGFVNKPMGLQRSLSDLESIGYQAVPFIIPACAVDAPHRRDRVWIVAHCDGEPSAFRGADKRHEEKSGRWGNKPQGSRSNDWGELGTSEDAIVAHASDGNRRRGTERQQSRNGVIRLHGTHRETLAHTDWAGQPAGEGCREDNRDESRHDAGRSGANVADAESCRVERDRAAWQQKPQTPLSQKLSGRDSAGSGAGHWATEPDVGRVAHGVSNRVDRIKALGNAVVPQVVTQIGKAILAAES